MKNRIYQLAFAAVFFVAGVGLPMLLETPPDAEIYHIKVLIPMLCYVAGAYFVLRSIVQSMTNNPVIAFKNFLRSVFKRDNDEDQTT